MRDMKDQFLRDQNEERFFTKTLLPAILKTKKHRQKNHVNILDKLRNLPVLNKFLK